VIRVIVFVLCCGFVVGANIWRSMKGKITRTAVLVEVTVCDADLVKIRVCSLATLGKKSARGTSSELRRKKIVSNITFQNIFFH